MPDEKKKISEDPKAKKLAAIKKSKGLFICTPIHSDVCLHYMKSCLDLQKECLLNNTNITFQLMKSSLVTQGRNLCVATFLDSSAHQMCFIDADVAFSVRSIFRLYECPYEVALIVYPMKTVDADKFRKDDIRRPSDHPDTKGYMFPVRIPDINEIPMDNGFIQVERGPAGCMMIKRTAFDKLRKAYSGLTIKQKTLVNGKMTERPNYYNFFGRIRHINGKLATGFWNSSEIRGDQHTTSC